MFLNTVLAAEGPLQVQKMVGSAGLFLKNAAEFVLCWWILIMRVKHSITFCMIIFPAQAAGIVIGTTLDLQMYLEVCHLNNVMPSNHGQGPSFHASLGLRL